MSASGPDWKKISLAIALLVVVRGVLLLSILPPFEGWDEYQHIAYVVYLKEQRELPSFTRSKVPDSVREMMKRYPHSSLGNSQHRQWGTKTYDTFWDETPNQPVPVPQQRPLYEAQQGPLYYVFALPFWIIFSKLGDLAAIYALRLINVLSLAAAVFVFLQTLARAVPNLQHRLSVALLVATYPLYLITAARVTNCALSILFGALTLHFIVSALKKRPLRYFAAATCFLGLGILAKATMFTMIPVLIAGILICAYQKKLNLRASIKTLAVCGGILFMILVPLLYRNYASSGAVYLMSQDLDLKGKSKFWVLSHFFDVDWIMHLRQWIFTRDLWFSGWSSFGIPARINLPYKAFLYTFWLVVIVTGLRRGWGRRPRSRRSEYLFSDDGDLIVFACTLFFMILGLFYFGTLSFVVYRIPIVMPSYFMIALPAWTALVYQAALWSGPGVAVWFTRISLFFFVGTELSCTLYLMPRMFTHTRWSMLSWERLIQIHPFFPGPWFIVPALVIVIGLLMYLLRALWRSESNSLSPA